MFILLDIFLAVFRAAPQISVKRTSKLQWADLRMLMAVAWWALVSFQQLQRPTRRWEKPYSPNGGEGKGDSPKKFQGNLGW